MDSIKELQDKIIKKIDDMMENTGVKTFELTDAMNNAAKTNPEYKPEAERISRYWRTIRDMNDAEQIWSFCVYVGKIISIVQEDKNKKELEKETQNLEWWKKYSKGEHDWQKKTPTPEEKQKRSEDLDNQPNQKDDFDEKSKKKYIAEIEFELKTKKVAEDELSKRLGISDWRVEINKTVDWSQACDRRWKISTIIRELKSDKDSEFTCASCGEKKKEYYKYPLEGGIKYCSAECWDKGEKKDDRPSKDRGKFKDFDVNEFFGWMKKMGVSELQFDFDKNQVVIKLNNGKNLDIKESGLTNKQQQDLTKQLKSSSAPINFSEVNEEFNKKGGNPTSKMTGKEIAFVGLVIVGVIAIIITLIVRTTRRNKD